jgi:hypothetical protein
MPEHGDQPENVDLGAMSRVLVALEARERCIASFSHREHDRLA